VLAQTREDWELIVVDDGSTDETARIVASFADPRITLICQANQGTGAARNTGLARARGAYVSLLDSDDLYLPTYLAQMGAALDGNPGVSLAYTQAWVLDDAVGRILRRTTAVAFQPGPDAPPDDPAALFRELLRDNFVFVATMVRLSAYEEAGGFYDEAATGSEDYEMWLRLAWQGHRFVRVREPLVVYRRRAGSKSATMADQPRHAAEVYRLVAGTYDLDVDSKRHVLARAAAEDARAEVLGGRAGLASVAALARQRARAVSRRVLWPVVMFARPPATIAETVLLTRSDPPHRASGQLR
jgi:GT2 family glycosyltransferase